MRSNEQYLTETIARLKSEIIALKQPQVVGASSHRSYKYFTSADNDFSRGLPAGVALEQYRVTYKLDSEAKFQNGAVVRARHFASSNALVMPNFKPPWAIGGNTNSELQAEPVTDTARRTYILTLYGNGTLTAQNFYVKFFFYGTSPGTIESIVRTL